MDVTLKNGLTYHVDEEMLGDMEVFESLVEIEKGNPVRLPDTVKLLIGEDGYEQMKESVRNKETGRVKTADFVSEFGAVMTAAGQGGKKK